MSVETGGVPGAIILVQSAETSDTKFHGDPEREELHRNIKLAVVSSLSSKPLIANTAESDGSVKVTVFVILVSSKPF